MVEASSSLTKLLVTNKILALGQLSLQSCSLGLQATTGEHVYAAIFSIALSFSTLGGVYWRFKINTVYSLNFFSYLAVLLSAINLLQYALPAIVKAILLGFFTGTLFAIQSVPAISQTIKTRIWGFKLDQCSSMLGIFLPPVLTTVWHNPKFVSIATTVHCAVFTSLLIYQLYSHSISAYAQEIDAIIEELKIQGQKLSRSDPETNTNDQLSESERKRAMWRYIAIRLTKSWFGGHSANRNDQEKLGR